MKPFMESLLICSVTMSAIALLVLALTPSLSKRYSARSLQIVCTIIALGFFIPLRPQLLPPAVTMGIPAGPSAQDIAGFIAALPAVGTGAAPAQIAAGPSPRISLDIPQAAFCVWLAGALAVLGHAAYRHIRFKRAVRRWSRPVASAAILSLLDDTARDIGLRRAPRLCHCPAVDSPMLVNLIRPTILLPDLSMPPMALSLVLRHELIHLRHLDLYGRVLLLLVSAIHWFNPLLRPAGRAYTFQCEASCDEAVTRNADIALRQYYSETIVGIIRRGPSLGTVLSTSYSGGKKSMKKRILSIMDTRRKKIGIGLMVMAVALSFLAGMGLALEGAPGGSAFIVNTQAYATPLITVPTFNDLDLPMGIYFNGTPVTVIETGEDFTRVSIGGDGLADGVSGYVQSGDILTDAAQTYALPTAAIAASSGTGEATLYLENAEGAQAIAAYPDGTRAVLLGCLADWYHVRIGDLYGFLPAGDLSLSGEVAENIAGASPESFDTITPSDKKAMDRTDAFYRDMVQVYGPEEAWPVEIKAEYATMNMTLRGLPRSDFGVDILPGENDLPLEDALALAREHILQTYTALSQQLLETYTVHASFIDFTYENSGPHWVFIFDIPELYGEITFMVTVPSPSGDPVSVEASEGIYPVFGSPGTEDMPLEEATSIAKDALMRQYAIEGGRLDGYAVEGMFILTDLTYPGGGIDMPIWAIRFHEGDILRYSVIVSSSTGETICNRLD